MKSKKLISDNMRSSRHGIKSALDKLYNSRFDTKLARTYTDDVSVSRGMCSQFMESYRPGQRDDAVRCTYTPRMHAL